MNKNYLQYQSKISLKKAIDKIAIHAMLGEHNISPRPTTKAKVCELLILLGENPNEIAEKCRDWREVVPYFENLLGSTWIFSGSGKAEIIDTHSDESLGKISDPGTISLSVYRGNLETACKARDRAVENASYADFQTALIHGIASIESYIAELARVWNKENSLDQLIDSKQNKVSLDDKFDIWIPKISKGTKLNKSDRCWNDFVTLRRIRDHEAVHPKCGGQAISYNDLAKHINEFRWGIAGLLGSLHRLVGQWIPSVVINAFYMPDVEVIK
jgi:hypothetical protein